jgi:hypothetical protein
VIGLGEYERYCARNARAINIMTIPQLDDLVKL